MKRVCLYFLFIVSTSQVCSQINDIIPFEFCNPNASELVYQDDQYFIPLLCAENISSIIKVGQNIEYYYYDRFAVSRFSLAIYDNDVLLFGKDRSMSNGLKICRIDTEDLSCKDSLSVLEPSDYDFPTGSLQIEDKFLVSYRFGPNSNSEGNIGLAMIDTSLNLLWKMKYDIQLLEGYVDDLSLSSTGNILMSYQYRTEGIVGDYSGLSKIDPDGNRIWDTKLTERLDNGATPTYHAELSNGNIVLSYEVDRWSDPVFIGNDWYRTPNRLLWLDDQGEFVKEKYILGPRTQEISLQNIDSGNGDYFFAYGFIEDVDNLRHGLITKYSNEGDTIWSRKVQHPDFSGLGHGHFIRDIIEHEDGTIAILARISTPGERSRIWLFELNEHGCFGDDTDCDDYVIVGETTDTTEIEPPTDQEFLLVPNPALDKVMIKTNVSITEAEVIIYSVDGSLVRYLLMGEDKSLNIRNLPAGIYFIRINSNGISMTKKLVKL